MRAAMLNNNLAAASGADGHAAKPKTQSMAPYSFEIEINDYPRKARWRVTSKDEISRLTEQTGVAITTRGSYCEPGKTLPPGERKLHLLVEADTEMALELAKHEIKRMLLDATVVSMETEARAGPTGRYSVV
jgi:ATP-dependent RNA helicase DDX46/PRP5